MLTHGEARAAIGRHMDALYTASHVTADRVATALAALALEAEIAGDYVAADAANAIAAELVNGGNPTVVLMSSQRSFGRQFFDGFSGQPNAIGVWTEAEAKALPHGELVDIGDGRVP